MLILINVWFSFIIWLVVIMNCFCGIVERKKAFMPYFQPAPLSEILTTANLRHAASRVWTCPESAFVITTKPIVTTNTFGGERILMNLVSTGVNLDSFFAWKGQLLFFFVAISVPERSTLYYWHTRRTVYFV